MAARTHGRLALVQLKPENQPEVLMIEVALSEDDKITIKDRDESVLIPPHIRMLTNELIQAVLDEVNNGSI